MNGKETAESTFTREQELWKKKQKEKQAITLVDLPFSLFCQQTWGESTTLATSLLKPVMQTHNRRLR